MKNKLLRLSAPILLAFAIGTTTAQEVAQIDQTARIIGNVSDGAPAPPQPENPQPEFEILDSKVVVENGRTITLRRTKKPDLPAPTILVKAELSAEEVEAFVQSREFVQETKSEFCFVSATVYGHNRTFVQWWPEGSKESCEAWSNIDFNLLGGFHAFQGRGQNYFFIMGVGNRPLAELGARRDAEENFPALDALSSPSPTYMVTKGDTNDAKAMKIMDAFHDLYEAEEQRLSDAYALREKHRVEREADLLANPPQPKDTIIHYWPKKGSRYQPPEQKGEGE